MSPRVGLGWALPPVSCAVSCLVLCVSAGGRGFLEQFPSAHFHVGDEEFLKAMEAVLGCGSPGAGRARTEVVERTLRPMWLVAPKDDEGRVNWRTARYLAHRYFLKTSSLLIRGLEPNRQVNESQAGVADILENSVPSLVDVMRGKRASQGFSLEQLVALVTTLEQVIVDSESSLLQVAYAQQGRKAGESLAHGDLVKVIESYMVYWVVGGDRSLAESESLLREPRLLGEQIPQWKAISYFAQGVVKGMEFSRSRTPRAGHGLNTMTQRYTFEDAHEAVASITNTFASFWESECQGIKASLVAMDKTGTGRVALSDFYSAYAAGEWRFAESEKYLRELGALDESSGRKQLIIANYLLGPNNCIVTNSHYFVCCVNECEAVLNDIEGAVGSPTALPSEILRSIENLTNFDDEPLQLLSVLRAQLDRIAETHGGRVPLHGRLFAQWLHYVIPQECPFPHKAGTHSVQAPNEFDGEYVVSKAQVALHASASANRSLAHELDEAQWMSQWSEEEELVSDYGTDLHAPWERYRPKWPIIGIALVVLLALVARATVQENPGANKVSRVGALWEPCQKNHFV